MKQPQIDYILYHLGMHVDISELKQYFRFGESVKGQGNFIYFPFTEVELDLSNVKFIEKDIPILFPGESAAYYHIDGRSLIYDHDILRSAFYLLSGEQEIKQSYEKPFNRFSWKDSIQKKLGITHKPLVNYYFKIIEDGFKEFCCINNLPFREKELFSEAILFSSHDIDRVKSYHLARVKMFLKKGRLLNAVRTFIGNILNLKDPWWNFDEILKMEEKSGIRSTWFFLGKGIRHLDSYYSLEDQKIKEVMQNLVEHGHEAGIHGTIDSAYQAGKLNKDLKLINSIEAVEVSGIRQHWLNYYPIRTASIQQKAGLSYDSSLGFHDHTGFRNSYCLPFKPYDFEKDSMINIWEFPLTAMDSSFSEYMGLSVEQTENLIENLMKEVRKFNGIFTLLIHNNYLEPLNKDKSRKRKKFYKNIIRQFRSNNFRSLTGREIANHIDRNEIFQKE